MENQLEMPKEEKRILKFTRKHLILGCTVLLIAAALVLNIVMFSGSADPTDPSAPAGDATDDGGSTAVDEGDGYFSATQVSRQRARDEALEVLQSVVDSTDADDAVKTQALTDINRLALEMSAESNIETLIMAKGFEDCVAVVNGDTATVVVKAKGEDGTLLPTDIAQINEIVYEQAKIMPVNITITER